MTDWPLSTSASTWWQHQRATTPAPYRAWVDEAFRQAGAVGRLRGELQALAATVEAVLRVYEQDIYRDARPTDQVLRDAVARALQACEETP